MLQVRNTTRSAGLAWVLVAFLAALQGEAFAASLDDTSDVPENGAAQATQPAYQVEATEKPLLSVLKMIRDRYNVRLCWEETPKDEVADRITASDMVRELKEIQSQRGLTKAQVNRLKIFQEDVAKGQGHFGVGWKEYRIQGVYSADTIPELLDLIMQESPYGWYEENGTYVVIPRQGSQLEYTMTIKVENALLSDVFRLVAEASPPSNRLDWPGNIWGMIGNIDEGQFEYIKEKHANHTVPYLHMESAPAIDVLNRAVEATGGHVTWLLSGLRKELIYITLPAEKNRWKTEYTNANK
jgi:hypothetical protein